MNSIVSEASRFAIVNAAGYSTRVGGSCPSSEVLQAMTYAQSEYFEIDDLLDLASKTISAATGSEAGIVTCGAGASLALAAAAVLAGTDVEIMDRLPDVSGLEKTEFLYPSLGSFDYDHPIRLTGAKLREVSFSPTDLEARLEAAVSPRVAGVIFVWKNRNDGELIRRIADFCRTKNLPFILDGAMGLPPEENLRGFRALGPNLIAISGGKHLGGPQNSGLLFGDENLVKSAWLQMVDMDVRASSWSRNQWLADGFVSRPPRHGIGRAMKVGKDAILGCLAAVQLYAERDFAAEREKWSWLCHEIIKQTRLSPNFGFEYLEKNWTEQYPVVKLQADTATRMIELRKKLKSLPRKIIMGEHEDDDSIAFLYPICLSEADIPLIAEALGQLTS